MLVTQTAGMMSKGGCGGNKLDRCGVEHHKCVKFRLRMKAHQAACGPDPGGGSRIAESQEICSRVFRQRRQSILITAAMREEDPKRIHQKSR